MTADRHSRLNMNKPRMGTMTRKNGPWTINESVTKYKNPWMEVQEDQVIRPDGKPGIFGVVKMKPGVSVLPVDNQGFVYLTKEFRYAVEEETIEVVSGAIDHDEAPLQADKRELSEELGIEAKEWIDLGVVHQFTSAIHSPDTLFLARGLSFTNSQQDGTETIELVKIKFEEVVNMVQNNDISHGLSGLLILKAHNYILKHPSVVERTNRNDN